jgi:hypothetical protein
MNQYTPELCQYIADYIQYEISDKGESLSSIDGETIQRAIDAFLGGAR